MHHEILHINIFWPLWNLPEIWELTTKAWRTFLVCITKDATKELPFILFFWQEIVEVKIGLKMHVDYNCFKTAFVVLKRHCYFFPRFADFCGRGDVWVKTPSCAFFKAFIGDGWTLLHLKSRWRFAKEGKRSVNLSTNFQILVQKWEISCYIFKACRIE